MADNTVSGWAVLYNEPTVVAQSFIEKISPGAFAGMIDDVALLAHHNHERVLARTTSGNLHLRDEGRMGLWFSAELDSANPDSAALLSAVGRADIHSMSFGFIVTKQEWQEPDDYDGLPIRTVLKAELLEVSAVWRPAYPTTSISLLRTDNASAAMRRLREKAERAHRLRGIR